MSGTYGHTSAKQFATYDPDTRSWKMWPDTGLWGSIEFSETWPKTGSMSAGRAYEHQTLERRTTGSGSSSLSHLPTVTASDGDKARDNPAQARRNSPPISAVSVHFPTPVASDGKRGGQSCGDEAALPGADGDCGSYWGSYAPVVRRWERVTRDAPPPTEPNGNGRQHLSAAFAEWMMGLPAGHVTGVPGVSRAEQLKAIGNGVCPQQAVAAIGELLGMEVA